MHCWLSRSSGNEEALQLTAGPLSPRLNFQPPSIRRRWRGAAAATPAITAAPTITVVVEELEGGGGWALLQCSALVGVRWVAPHPDIYPDHETYLPVYCQFIRK